MNPTIPQLVKFVLQRMYEDAKIEPSESATELFDLLEGARRITVVSEDDLVYANEIHEVPSLIETWLDIGNDFHIITSNPSEKDLSVYDIVIAHENVVYKDVFKAQSIDYMEDTVQAFNENYNEAGSTLSVEDFDTDEKSMTFNLKLTVPIITKNNGNGFKSPNLIIELD